MESIAEAVAQRVLSAQYAATQQMVSTQSKADNAKQLRIWRAYEVKFVKDLANVNARIKDWTKLAADGDPEYVEALNEKLQEKKRIEQEQAALQTKIAAAVATTTTTTATITDATITAATIAAATTAATAAAATTTTTTTAATTLAATTPATTTAASTSAATTTANVATATITTETALESDA